MTPPEGPNSPVTIGVYVCTYRRNEELHRFLESLVVAAQRVASKAAVGVVVVDDNVDGRAKDVVTAFDASAFAGGLHYRHTGSGNISTARNMGLETAGKFADWVAMTDDDCVVSPDWLVELLRIQQEKGVSAVTGPMLLRFAPGSPTWLSSQPFAELGSFGDLSDGQSVSLCATNNSMISGEFLRSNPDIRFDKGLGKLGGEDMVFYRRAMAAGLTAAYSTGGIVWGEESAERSTFRYQMRQGFWLGNTEAVTNLRTKATGRGRLVLRGGRRLLGGLRRPFDQMRDHKPLQLRYALAVTLQGLGLMLGAVGLEVEHK